MTSDMIFKIGVPVKGKFPIMFQLHRKWAQMWTTAGQARRIRELTNQVEMMRLVTRESEEEAKTYKIQRDMAAKENHDLKIKIARMEGKR